MSKKKTIPAVTIGALWSVTKGKCEHCGRIVVAPTITEKRFNLHHKKFRVRCDAKKEDVNDIMNLAVLCEVCHGDVHAYRGDWTKRYRTHRHQKIGMTEEGD